MGGALFETIARLWEQYSRVHQEQWAKDDPLHGLSAEVLVRLRQLDLVLEYCGAALAAIEGDPGKRSRGIAWIRGAQPKLARGEISKEEYLEGLPKPSLAEARAVARAFEEVQLFTEMFYVVAWRLVEILNGPRPRKFLGISRIEAKGVRDARNLLIEHPEHRKGAADFSQRLVVTDDGPVLKSSGVIIRGPTPRVEASADSLDRGLFVNATELLQELELALGRWQSLPSMPPRPPRPEGP